MQNSLEDIEYPSDDSFDPAILDDILSVSRDGSWHQQEHGDNSSISDDGNWQRSEGDCICGGDSDTELWADEKRGERGEVQIEVDQNISPHKQLHRAIRKHDCRMIRHMLEDGIDLCTKYKSSRSCFILAHESKFILRKFLEIDPSGINCQDSEGSTMLMLALDTYEDIFDLLCTFNPDVHMRNDDGDNVLHVVLKGCSYHNPSKIRRILDLGIDVNDTDGRGDSPLILAVKAGCNAHIIEMLFDAGATLPPQDEVGKTLLMHAVEAGDENFSDIVDVLKVLLTYGEDASAKDFQGHNAMRYIMSECLPNAFYLRNGDELLTEIMIELLERSCEVQGLGRIFQKSEIISMRDPLIRKLPVTYDVITTLVRNFGSIELLKQLVQRDLYSKITLDPYILSPLSACIFQLIADSHVGPCVGLHTLKMAMELIQLRPDDVSHRVWHQYCCPYLDFPLDHKHRTRNEYQAAVARELEIPDALLFATNMRIFNYELVYGDEIPVEEDNIYEVDVAVDELLRMLLRFWPHPPLLLMLLRVDPIWCPLLVTRTGISSNSETGMIFMMENLVRIGGSLPLGTRYYAMLKSALQRMAGRNDLFKPMLNMLLELDGGIPTLQSLSRTVFRATVKKTCPTGLDFSEYRVLCRGKMVPIPTEVVNYLEFRE